MMAYQVQKIWRNQRKIAGMLCFLFFVECCFCCGSVISAKSKIDTLDSKDISVKFPPPKPISRANSFILSPHSLQDLLKRDKDVILVDVRNSDEFQKVRIPGSINIPLFTLKTKAFLKPKSLVLLNNGLGYGALELECRQLKDHGFQSIRILYGGLNYWRGVKGPLEGDFFAINELAYIWPAEYFVDRNYDDWLVIDTSGIANKKGKDLISGIVHMPYSGNDEEFAMKLSEIITKRSALLSHYILIVSNEGKNYYNINKIIKNNPNILNIFYLQGGLVEYAEYLEKQTAMSHSNKKIVEKCESCP